MLRHRYLSREGGNGGAGRPRPSKTSLVLCVLVLSGCFAFGLSGEKDATKGNQALSPADPESAGFCPERLLLIDNLLRRFVERRVINGAIALVARQGRMAYYHAVGFRDLEKRVPIRKDDIFRTASQTKAITSVAAMMLWQEGKMSLDEPVSRYVPELPEAEVFLFSGEEASNGKSRPSPRPVTVRDLLTHVSGYCYPSNKKEWGNTGPETFGLKSALPSHTASLKEEMQRIAGVPLVHAPGAKFTYDCLNSDILGFLIEKVSGQSLDDFFRTRIFEPLGMKDTYFRLPEDKNGRLLPLYAAAEAGKGIRQPSRRYSGAYFKEVEFYSGGRGLCSTAMDYAIFMQMLLNGGEYNGVRLLQRETVQMMTTNQIGALDCGSLFATGGKSKFGLGFELIGASGSTRSPISDGSFGWGGAFGSLYWIDPVEEMIVQLVIQVEGNNDELRGKFINAVYQALQ